MPIITPSFGLIFWMLVGFAILFFILAKFAWPVITRMISEREKYIEEQLTTAEKVRQEMSNLQAEHQKLLAAAKEERDMILADARKIRDKMYEDSKAKSMKEANAIIEEAKKAIHYEKLKAVTDIKNEIANMSIEIAEKLLRQELSDKEKHEKLVTTWIKEFEMN